MHYCKLTIFFEDPFWVGLAETEDEQGYQAAKHTFGSEPSYPEISAFVCTHWNELRFTEALEIHKAAGKKINHKRMQRIIAKELKAHASKGTKAQQALAQQREAQKTESKMSSKAQRKAEEQERFAKRTEKRKQKHRGH